MHSISISLSFKHKKTVIFEKKVRIWTMDKAYLNILNKWFYFFGWRRAENNQWVIFHWHPTNLTPTTSIWYEHALSEDEEAEKKARSASAPGPNDVPYCVYKNALDVLKLFWRNLLFTIACEKQVMPKT